MALILGLRYGISEETSSWCSSVNLACTFVLSAAGQSGVGLRRPSHCQTSASLARSLFVSSLTRRAMKLLFLVLAALVAQAYAGGYLAAGGVYQFDPDKNLDYMQQARDAGNRRIRFTWQTCLFVSALRRETEYKHVLDSLLSRSL